MSKNWKKTQQEIVGEWSASPLSESAANDNWRFDPIHPGGASEMRPVRFSVVNLTETQLKVLTEAANEKLAQFAHFPTDPNVQVALAIQFAKMMKLMLPEVCADLRGLKQGQLDAVYATGLPLEENVAALVMMSMSSMIGDLYNFESQNGGALIMKLRPKAGSGQNNNATKGEFLMHTDDAAIPRASRVHHICLLGRVNPVGVYTNYAPLQWAISHMVQLDADLAERDIAKLMSPDFQVAFPKSLGVGDEVWTSRRPVLNFGPDGRLELAFPSYNTRPANSHDQDGLGALERLHSALESVKKSIALSPGTYLAFSNLRGAHSRDEIGEREREIWRNYAAESLRHLQTVTGCQGPIFPVGAFAADATKDRK